MTRPWIRDLRSDDSVEPRCRPETIVAAVAEIGEQATSWAVGTAADAARASLARSYGGDPPPAVVNPVREVCEACVLALLRSLYRGDPAGTVDTPVEAEQSARDAVHAGLPLERLLRTMWNAHVTTVDALIVAMRGRTGGVWTDDAREVGHLSFALLDAFSDWIVREYNSERDAWLGSLAAARRELVEAVLTHRPVDTGEAERTFGIRLTGPLVGVVVWSERRAPVPDHELHALASALARAADADAPLTVQGGPSVLWAWLPLRRPPPDRPGEALRALVTPGPGLRAAFGSPGTGLAGFRRTHLTALRARSLAAVEPASWLTDYRSLAVLSLLTNDGEEAGWFARDVLGGLAAPGERPAMLRETLRAYLAAGRGRQAAAEQLHVAPGTVAYRVRQAEQLIGRPLRGIDREIALALEVMRAPVPGGPPVSPDHPPAPPAWDPTCSWRGR